MNVNRIHNLLRLVLKHSALALAATAGLAIGTSHATIINSFTGGIANVSGYYASPGNAQYNAGAEGFTPNVSGGWTGGLDVDYGPPLYFFNDTTFTLTADPGYTVTLEDFDCGQYSGTGSSSFTVLDSDDNVLATVSGVETGSMEDFTWPVLKDTKLKIVFASTEEDYTWINNIKFSQQEILPATITAFGPGATVGALVANAGNIAWTVPFGTNVTTLAPTFTLSSGTCDKDNGGPTTYDFTNPVTYTVTDGPTINVYTVTVTVTPASSQKDILSFGPYAVISGTNIAWTVPFGSNVTTLAPTYTVSTFASGSPVSGTTRNFTTPQVYTITAQDTSTQDYTVTVTVAPDESTVIWDLTGGGAWDLGTPNWKGQISSLPTTFSNGDNVIFDKTNGGTITIAANMSPLTTTVSATSGTYTFSGGPIATGSLTKSGGGTLVLNSPNTYAGDTLIEGGRVRIENEVQDALGTGTVTLNGAILELSRQDIANTVIVGASGGTISGGNSFADDLVGAVTLNGLLTIDSGATGSHRITGNITGTGGITKTGGPYGNGLGMILSGTNTYSGATTIQSGVARITQPAALGGGDLIVETDGKLNLNYTGTRIVSSLTLGGVVKTDPGTYGSTASGADFQNDTYFPPKGPFDSYDNLGTVTLVLSYADWATLYAGGPTALPGDDFNNDGVENGVAFFMGMNGVATNPGVVGNSVTWPNVNAVTSYKVQTSGNLSGWTDVLPGDPRLTDTGPGGSVSYNLLPNTPNSLFVRLLVTP